MYKFLVFSALFFQVFDPKAAMTPQAKLARAEAVIAEKQKAVESAITQEAIWQTQIITRTKEKQDLINTVKGANNLDNTWIWDDKTSKFIKK